MSAGPPKPRFFLDRDNSGHWYLVPEERRAEWDAWSNLDEDDEASWNEPTFAKRLNGHPARVTFTNPREATPATRSRKVT